MHAICNCILTSTKATLDSCFFFSCCHQPLLAGWSETFFSASFWDSNSTNGLMSEWTATSDFTLLWNSSGLMSTCGKEFANASQ